MGHKKWFWVVGIAVVFFMCVGMTFIPLAFGMMRTHQPMYYAPMQYAPMQQGGEDGATYPMMPYGRGMWGGHHQGGVLMLLPMLTCVALPLVGLVFAGLYLARRHAWKAAMLGDAQGGEVPPWMHKHWAHHKRKHDWMQEHFAQCHGEGVDAATEGEPEKDTAVENEASA